MHSYAFESKFIDKNLFVPQACIILLFSIAASVCDKLHDRSYCMLLRRGIIAAIHDKNASYLSPRIVDEFGYIYVVNRLNNSDLCITRKSVRDPYEPENCL